MRVKLIEKTEDFLKLQEFWNDVLHKSNANFPFLTFEWQSSWWKSFGKSKKLFVLTAVKDKNGNPHGIAPLMIDKSVGFKVVKFIGTGRSDYLDFIIEDKTDETVEVFLAFLNENRKSWDLIFLSDILSDNGSVDKISNAARAAGWGTGLRQYYSSPYIPINGNSWSDFLSSKSSNFRYSLKRKEKFLEKSGLKLKIVRINSNDLDQQIFKDMVEIEKSSWKFDGGNLNMQDEQAQEFFLNYLQNFAKKGWMNVWIGYLDEKPVAYLINFDYKEKIWFYNAGYHEQARRYGIGSILMHNAVKDAFLRGKTEYDFMRGVEEYKERWTSMKRESFQLVLYKKSVRSMLGYFFLFRFRWFLAKSEKLREIRSYFIICFRKVKNTLS